MQAYSQPLIKLQVEATRFLRDRSLRLLHVVADVVLHDAVVELLAAQELRADNRSPFVILQEPHKQSDPGWDRRALTIRRQHEHRRAEMAEHGEALAELPEPPASKGLVGLAEQLGQLLVARPDDTEGLVVLLAPAYVEAPDTWQQSLGVLLSLAGLAAVRFMIVDRERSTLSALVARHEGRALTTRCRVEGESPKAVLAGALDEELLRFGGPLGARPKGVVPPRRVNDLPEAPPDPSAVLQLAVSRNVLLASVAVDEGRMPDAIAHQRQARDASMQAGRIEQGVMMELVLGGYLLAAGASAQAQESYRRAATVAEDAELPDKAAMARLALGSSQLIRHDRTSALVQYAQASTIAERAGHDALALHACRLTGDVAHELHMDAQAIAFWAKAIEIAERDPPTAPLSSAWLAALNLALLCRERGQREQAEVFLAKANALRRLDPERLQLAAEPPPAEPPPRDPSSSIEATEQLTWADLAALHGEPTTTNEDPTGTELVHHWSPVEQDTLRTTTTAIIGRETTALLSRDEMRALRGEVDLPPAQVSTVERTQRLDPAELERLRGGAPAPTPTPAPAPPIPPASGEGTEIYSQDMIRELRAAWAKREEDR
jgi:tetratricopeptide (TPR) repeat protein